MSGATSAGESPGGPQWGPHNTVTVVDPSPVNWLSITWNTMLTVVDENTVRMRFPGGDAAALMKLRGMHIPSTRFWNEWGFVDPKTGSAEGHW